MDTNRDHASLDTPGGHSLSPASCNLRFMLLRQVANELACYLRLGTLGRTCICLGLGMTSL
jgi:hypothetical protein